VAALYPFDRRWYYGDAVFIFEPWLWLLLGLAAAWNARSLLARTALSSVIVLLAMALAYAGAIPGRALASLAVVGLVLAWTVRRLSPRARSAAALAASALFVLILVGLSRRVRKEAIARVRPETRGEIVDVVRYPNPAWPLCWAVIVIEKDERGGEFVLRPGTLSVLPWPPVAQCASRWLARGGPARASGGGRLTWEPALREPLQGLRDLAARDCWVRAWLQFGRAPYLRADDIRDLRFETAARGNFTALRLRPASEAAQCPPHMTSWAMPRADLLEPSP
jgi:inner membrane protein